jgi:hypothetical protein
MAFLLASFQSPSRQGKRKKKLLRMKEMIQDTSLLAHKIATHNLGRKQKEVLDCLRYFRDATNAELSARMGWPVNRIAPRVLELRKMGLILDAGRRSCKVTGSTAHSWRAKHPVLPPAREEIPKVEQTKTPLRIWKGVKGSGRIISIEACGFSPKHQSLDDSFAEDRARTKTQEYSAQ